jgi:hypothetical protein
VKPAARAFWINFVLETEDKMRSRRGADMVAQNEHPEAAELAMLFRRLEHRHLILIVTGVDRAGLPPWSATVVASPGKVMLPSLALSGWASLTWVTYTVTWYM